MAYSDVAALNADPDFRQRTMAAYATQILGSTTAPNVEIWQRDNGWEMAAQPGFGDAYGYAMLNGNPRPGYDPAVITDAQILSAVQGIVYNQGIGG